jgi:hypothetical protein
MNLETPGLPAFVDHQLREFGGNVEIATGLWALLGVEATDQEGNAIAHALLVDAPFAHEAGSSEDERWNLHYIDSANRPAAMHWLDDIHRQLLGDIRLPSPEQRRQLDELAESAMPHRIAQKLGEDHAAGRLSAGSLRTPALVRALLDRLHLREPLFYSAFHQLLTQHLFDMVVLLQQLIPEDVALTNESVKGSVSRDPFLQTRQSAAAEIRRMLVDFFVIDSLDQQKATLITNPYAAYMDVQRQDDAITLLLEGNKILTTREYFMSAIHSIRRNIYLGGQLAQFDTQAPWMRDEIAHPFRFIKQRLEVHRALAPLDGLYMLERAVEG